MFQPWIVIIQVINIQRNSRGQKNAIEGIAPRGRTQKQEQQHQKPRLQQWNWLIDLRLRLRLRVAFGFWISEKRELSV